MTDFAFNPFDDATRRDPAPLFARARREHPVYRHPEFPIVSLFKYADIQGVLRDPETWSSRFPPPPGVDPAKMPEPSMLGQDPPNHTRLRGLVSQAFTPRIIRRLEPRMHEIAAELMDRALAQDTVDFVEAMTYPLPVIVIAEMLGVDPADRRDFKRWSDWQAMSLNPLLGEEERAAADEADGELADYLRRVLAERRAQPRDDLISALIAAEAAGDQLTDDEIVTMCELLWPPAT